MRLTTWNVNGIRNPFSYQPWNSARSFPAMFDILGSDIVVMQELKIQRKDLRDDMVILDGWDCYFSLPKHKKGYSGVGIYTRNETCAPIRAEEGLIGVLASHSGAAYRDLPADQSIGGYPSEAQVAELGVDPAMLDAEGRCVVLEFPAFVLFGVYSPANSNGLRDDFRYGFICALDCRIRNLVRSGKSVVLVGDLNVSRDERDGASALEDCKKAGITHDEYISTPNRRIFNQLLIEGEVAGERDEGRERGVLWDTTRGFHPERKGMYTHWETKINARPGNYGSRIDFVLVSEALKSWIKDANIQEGLLGSDHCPVFADFFDDIDHGGRTLSFADIMNPSGTFVDGQRKQDWRVQEVPAMSGKRLPEFDKRRSIKSMFTTPGLKSSPSNLAPSRAREDDKEEDRTNGTAARVEDESRVPMTGASPRTTKATSLKRTPSTTPKAAPTKKLKSEPPPFPSRGQQSLKGFFQPRTTHLNGSNSTPPSLAADDSRPEAATSSKHSTPHLPDSTQPSTAGGGETFNGAANDGVEQQGVPPGPDASDEPASPAFTDDTLSPAKSMRSFESRQQTHHNWNALFSRPVAPLCETHEEPCKSMLTKKKGSNQGRSFWMCARPLGPSGNKERGTEWRCPTFIWCSDWDARGGNGKDGGGKDGEGQRNCDESSTDVP